MLLQVHYVLTSVSSQSATFGYIYRTSRSIWWQDIQENYWYHLTSSFMEVSTTAVYNFRYFSPLRLHQAVAHQYILTPKSGTSVIIILSHYAIYKSVTFWLLVHLTQLHLVIYIYIIRRCQYGDVLYRNYRYQLKLSLMEVVTTIDYFPLFVRVMF